MPRAPSSFRQGDIAKAIRAAASAGLQVSRVEVDKDGRIIIVAGEPLAPACPERHNEWDTVLHDKD